MSGIEIKNITKKYKEVCALDNVSLTLQENKIYGLLGRNGAGKSTLLNIITERIFPDNGEVYVDGDLIADSDKPLSKIYLMSEKNCYPLNMKVKDAFRWSKNFYPDFDEAYALGLAERFDLNRNAVVKSLSTGYRSIFKLIIALSVNVPYIFLDEPVLGLDANHRDLFYRLLIEKYSEHPCTIVISTHLIEEVANIIEDIIIIKKGKIIRNESRESLLSEGYAVSGTASAVDAYIANKNVIGMDSLGGLKTAYLMGVADKQIPQGLELSKLDLQKLFIQLTNY